MSPERKIGLIDAYAVGAGASGRNAGFLLQGASSDYLKDRAAYGAEGARRLWRFTRASRDLLFEELDGSAFDLESSGSFVVAGTEQEDRRLRECVPVMRANGAPATYFRAEETNKRLSSVGFGGSLYVPSGGMLNPLALVRYLAAASRAETIEHAPARSVEMRSNGVEIETDRCVIRADRVVLAVNAWLPQLFPSLERYVRPVRAQMLSTGPAGRRWLDVPIYSHEGYFYARQSLGGAVLAGGARHLHAEAETGFGGGVTDAVQRDIEEYLRTHFPAAAGLEVDRRWSGLMGFSPDRLPVIGSVPGVPGSLWAAGFSGHGVAYGFAFGQLLAHLVLERIPSTYELFTADRFESPTRTWPAPSSTRTAAAPLRSNRT
jgi:glycine/D-amino acid oxidase-like deaminating enzyme